MVGWKHNKLNGRCCNKIVLVGSECFTQSVACKQHKNQNSLNSQIQLPLIKMYSFWPGSGGFSRETPLVNSHPTGGNKGVNLRKQLKNTDGMVFIKEHYKPNICWCEPRNNTVYLYCADYISKWIVAIQRLLKWLNVVVHKHDVSLISRETCHQSQLTGESSAIRLTSMSFRGGKGRDYWCSSAASRYILVKSAFSLCCSLLTVQLENTRPFFTTET